MAMTLRKTMFLNGVLTNVNIWYNLKKCETEELDRCLLPKNIFVTQLSCPKEALHLESGTTTVGTVIKSRRIN